MGRVIYPLLKSFNTDGTPLIGGKAYTYEPGTETHKTTYSDPARKVANKNPVILNPAGEHRIALADNDTARFIVKNSAGSTIFDSDNISRPWEAPATADLTTFKAYDKKGNPLVGGKVYTYKAGTSTPEATYSDTGLVTQNSNPVILDANGEADIFRRNSLHRLKIILKDSVDRPVWSHEFFTAPNLFEAEKQGLVLNQFAITSAYVEEIPIDMSSHASPGSIQNLCIDDDNNVYVGRTWDGILKLQGFSSNLDSEITLPVEYPVADGWYFTVINWTAGRLAAVLGKLNYSPFRYVEFVGFTNQLYYDRPLTVSGSVDPRFLDYDAGRGWLVGVTTKYNNGYKDYLAIWDYATGDFIQLAGRLFPYQNGAYLQGFLDAANHLIYTFNHADNRLYWFDYTAVVGTGTISAAGSILITGQPEGPYGCELDADGDMWLMGLGYAPYLSAWAWRMDGISNTQKPA